MKFIWYLQSGLVEDCHRHIRVPGIENVFSKVKVLQRVMKMLGPKCVSSHLFPLNDDGQHCTNTRRASFNHPSNVGFGVKQLGGITSGIRITSGDSKSGAAAAAAATWPGGAANWTRTQHRAVVRAYAAQTEPLCWV